MDFTTMLLIMGGLTYIGFTIYLANQIDALRADQATPIEAHGATFIGSEAQMQQRVLNALLYGAIMLTFLLGLMVFQVSLIGEVDLGPDAIAPPQIDLGAASITLLIALIASIYSFRLVSAPAVRAQLARWIGTHGSFRPESSVHLTAVVLSLSLAAWIIASFVFGGGLSGVAEGFEQSTIRAADLLLQMVIQVMVALLGVGLAIRRGLAEALERLGLRLPTTQDVIWGVGVGVAGIIMMIVFNIIWQALTPPDEFARQTQAVEVLNQAFATLPMAFVLAFSAAVGEEIWIRGALQPIFGILPTSLFFVVLHTQVVLTPAVLVILGVSIAFGWLRQRHSTTSVIIAHFIYNFIPLALLALATPALS